MRRRPVRTCSALAALVLALWPTAAHADLGRDVDALTLGWRPFGRVLRLEPRLLERGDVLPLVLPVEVFDANGPRCATVAVVGTPNVHFLFDPGRRSRSSPTEWPEGSLAGVLQATRCGAAKAQLASLALEMRSPRGVLEFLVLGSEAPPPLVTTLLRERDPGPLAQPLGSGPRPVVAPLHVRVRALEERASRDQAIELSTLELTAGGMGHGSSVLTLGPGCHRFELLGEETERRAADVDLEITEATHDIVLAVDHGESSDGGALVCVASPTTVNVRFGGVAPFAKLALVRARWDLDPSLPARWPGDARARMSGLLRVQRRTLGNAPLVDEALGVQGDTLASLEVVPGACYLALAVGLRGEVAALTLAAEAGHRVAQSRIDPDVPGAALSFCAGREHRVLVEVDARGLALHWMSAIWQIGRTRLGEVAR